MIQDETLRDYLDHLAAGTPTPGGGAAAALTLAQAAALVAMAGRFTVGKERFKEMGVEAAAVIKAADDVREVALSGVDQDAAAFAKVAEAFRQPRTSDTRARTIAEACLEAARVPLGLLLEAAKLKTQSSKLRAGCNPNLVIDLDVADALMTASAHSFWYNITANLDLCDRKDEVQPIRSEGSRIMAEHFE